VVASLLEVLQDVYQDKLNPFSEEISKAEGANAEMIQEGFQRIDLCLSKVVDHIYKDVENVFNKLNGNPRFRRHVGASLLYMNAPL
jgi:hypothetical protein